jgi:uncharacterized membrane protein YGL010W
MLFDPPKDQPRPVVNLTIQAPIHLQEPAMTANASSNTPTPMSGASTRRIDQLLDHYGESHQHPGNELIHYVAIPLIVFSLIGLLQWAHPYLAMAAIAGSIMYYARLSNVFMICMALMGALCLYLAGLLGSALLPVSIGVFVVSWIFQFIGHKLEGKKPSFLEDLQYLLVGPLFVLSKLFLKLGVKW